MKYDEAKQLIARAIVIYPHMKTGALEETAKVWSEMLSDIDYADAMMALKKHVANSDFPPTIASIRKNAKEIYQLYDGIPTAEEAWTEVMRTLNRYKRPQYTNPLIDKAVDFMGYANLCDSENAMADRAQFIKAYNNLKERRNELEGIEAVQRLANRNVASLTSGTLKLMAGDIIDT